jgi:pilus assembly protein CpaC
MRRLVELLALAALSVLVLAQTQPAKEVNLISGKGELLQFQNDVQKVVVAEPKIADAIVVSPREVMLSAKGAGKTTIAIWETGAAPALYNVNVIADSTDFDKFRKEVQENFPEDSVKVSGQGETLVLTGSVKNAEASKRAGALASTRAKTVVNLLEVPPAPDPRQIMLAVKFASIDRTALTQIGFNLFSTNGKGLGTLTTEQFQQPRFTQLTTQNGGTSTPSVNFADLLNLFIFRPDLNLGATIEALQQQDLLQILAEPNLITSEGTEASFLAGGQFPFPTLTSTTTGGAISPVITVQFKQFGVQLSFTPTITQSGAINLKVKPEVSSLDFANAVTLQGFQIPALATRKAETEIVLKDGESFAIAGLINNQVVETVARVKGLGDIPILGALFRSRSTKKSADELLVLVTPHFVRPIAPGEVTKTPDMPAAFLPTVAEEKAKKKRKKGSQDPTFVGPRGHEEPK